ncbi:MAG: protein-L-isoaspartate O-methyltransferase [Gammaproteobacteria bacterium]|nr:protein-L-isoaspartate O-methyltransferase [Gammaproteobacteria bacterium]
MSNAAQAKFNMIEQQIRPWEVIDARVLDVFNSIERVHFVPDQYKGLAYADCQLPVVEGESMLPPVVEGRMLQALGLKPGDSVLEVGSGCGYITACLATLADNVTSVDLHARATEMASAKLQELDITNVECQTISSLEDITLTERYDVITIGAGSLTGIPQNLKNALVIDGRLFAITGASPAKQAQLITRVSQTEWKVENLFETDIPDIS